jgi:hypothetical protein
MCGANGYLALKGEVLEAMEKFVRSEVAMVVR